MHDDYVTPFDWSTAQIIDLRERIAKRKRIQQHWGRGIYPGNPAAGNTSDRLLEIIHNITTSMLALARRVQALNQTADAGAKNSAVLSAADTTSAAEKNDGRAARRRRIN